MMTPIDSLIDQLNNGATQQQVAAAEQMSRMGEAAYPAIPSLVNGCGSSDEDVRSWCNSALEETGPPAARQISDLAALALSANSDIAYWAVTMLGTAGRDAVSATGSLVNRLHDDSAINVQQRAAWALGRIGPFAPEARSALTDAAASSGPVASQAQRALDQIRAA